MFYLASYRITHFNIAVRLESYNRAASQDNRYEIDNVFRSSKLEDVDLCRTEVGR